MVIPRAGWNACRRSAQRIVGTRPRPAPWNSRVIDDVADGRPWNILVKTLRATARVRRNKLRRGPTVLVVNWNTAWLLRRLLPTLIDELPAGVPIRVVDNGSRDSSTDYLRSLRPRVRCLRLPVNVGHALALDIGTLTSRTETVVILDSDAFPIAPGWLDAVLGPVANGKSAAGLQSSRGFVHPSFMALDVRTFVKERLSFQVHRVGDPANPGSEWGVDRWDTGELLSRRLGRDRLAFLQVARSDRGLPGVIAGGVVYHHGAMSRQPDGRLTAESIEGFDRAMNLLRRVQE